MKKKLALLLVLAFVLAGCAQSLSSSEEKGDLPASKTETANSTVNDKELANTSDWQTYETKEFGVKLGFRYPQGVEISEESESYGKFRSFALAGGGIIIRAWTDPVLASRANVNDYAVSCNVDESNTKGAWIGRSLPKGDDEKILGQYMKENPSLLICYVGDDLVLVDQRSMYTKDDLRYEILIESGGKSASKIASFLDDAYAFVDTFSVQELAQD